VRVLREGLVDVEIGVLGATGPEVRIQTLLRDDFVGVAREGHPLFGEGEVTPKRYAACGHASTPIPHTAGYAVIAGTSSRPN